MTSRASFRLIPILLALASALRIENDRAPSCSDELSSSYPFMEKVGKSDSTVFYIYGRRMAEGIDNQFFVFSSEPGSGKFGAKSGNKKRHLNYFVVKGENCTEPTKTDCIADPKLFPNQKPKGSNKPGNGWHIIIGPRFGRSMSNVYDGRAFGLGKITLSLAKDGVKMVATTESGCQISRVNVCSEEGGKPKVLDIYNQDGKFCETLQAR